MSSPEFTLYIDSRDVAKRVGWRTERVQRLWRSAGIALKRGKSIMTTRHLLREHYPEQWEAILDTLFG